MTDAQKIDILCKNGYDKVTWMGVDSVCKKGTQAPIWVGFAWEKFKQECPLAEMIALVEESST